MSRKRIGLLVVGALVIVGAAMSGGTDPAAIAATEPSPRPVTSQSTSPSVVPASPSPSIASASPSPSVAPASPTVGLVGTVTEVVDGDTIRVELPIGLETVRIIGIDTPEVVHPTQPEACYGAQASAFAKKTLNGQTVRLEVDATQDERDRYDRLLAHVFVGDELYGEAAIAAGFAIHYIYERPSSYAAEFDAAAAAAKANEFGIWAECDGRVDLPAVVAVPSVPPAEEPAATTKPTQDAGCHPSYEPCVPNEGRDLDCSDIGFQVRVIGPDEYRLDGSDNDGRGCESY